MFIWLPAPVMLMLSPWVWVNNGSMIWPPLATEKLAVAPVGLGNACQNRHVDEASGPRSGVAEVTINDRGHGGHAHFAAIDRLDNHARVLVGQGGQPAEHDPASAAGGLPVIARGAYGDGVTGHVRQRQCCPRCWHTGLKY